MRRGPTGLSLCPLNRCHCKYEPVLEVAFSRHWDILVTSVVMHRLWGPGYTYLEEGHLKAKRGTGLGFRPGSEGSFIRDSVGLGLCHGGGPYLGDTSGI
jgi:hypothetical protein